MRLYFRAVLYSLFLSLICSSAVLALDTNKDISLNDSSGEVPTVSWSVNSYDPSPAIRANSNTGEVEYRDGGSDVWTTPMGFIPLTSAELAALASPRVDVFYYTTDTHLLHHWNGSVFIEVNGGGAPMAETPTYSPPGGSYEDAQTVSISAATPNSVIYYTLDGSKPTDESAVYSGPLSIGNATTIRAIAIASQHQSSNVGQAVYSITGANRIYFSTKGANVTMKLNAPGATVVWYWSDGTTYNGQSPGTKGFGTTELRSHSVTVDPPSALIDFGNNGDTVSRVSSITGLGKFPHLHRLYLYKHGDLTELDVEGITEMNRLHLNNSSLDAASCDSLLNALAAQDIPYNNAWGNGEWYPGPLSANRTSASDAAVATLSSKGWPSP